MLALEDLQARVAAIYERHEWPAWPDPHPGGTQPREEEYSRLTDPGRYRVVHARGRAWVTALEEVPGTRADVVAGGGIGDGGFDRGVRVVPSAPGALPLLLLERDVAWEPDESGESTESDQPPLALLTVSLARPEVVIERQPDCGCDACDSGSADLLEAIDAAIRRVVGGPFVALRGAGWNAQWHPDGGSAGGVRTPDFRALMDTCRRLASGEHVGLPKRTEVLISRGWLG